MDRQPNSSHGKEISARLHAPEVQPLLQALSSTLANIDFLYKADLKAIMNCAADEALKRKAIEKLQHQHRERRDPYVRQLAALQQQISA